MKDTLKATDLRIGNYVCGDFKVISICKESLELDSELHDMHINIEKIDNVFPTPLDELWFEKFGFKSIGLHGQVFEHNQLVGDNRFVIETDGIFFYPKINFDDVCWSEFKYVHQLQNLYFALTGNELTFKEK